MEYFSFTETLIFEQKALKLIGDDQVAELEFYLCKFYDRGAVIPGSNGIRKMRWSASGRGKRGGARVIYYVALSEGRILLLDLYAKNERDDLNAAELKKLKHIVSQWK